MKKGEIDFFQSLWVNKWVKFQPVFGRISHADTGLDYTIYNTSGLCLGVFPEAEKSLLRFKKVIIDHNEGALKNPEHPRAVYREPSALIVICANAPMSYTTESGVKIIPVGCLRD